MARQLAVKRTLKYTPTWVFYENALIDDENAFE